MPATHQIDSDKGLIITSWQGEPTDGELIDALVSYQGEIQGKPELISFNEIVDFSKISGIKLSADGIKKLGKLAARTDSPGSYRKLAIVINSSVAYGLARIYVIFRSLTVRSNKEIRIFNDMSDALSWINKPTSK